MPILPRAIINHHQRAALDDDWETQRLKTLAPTLSGRQVDELLHPPGGRHYGHVMPLRNQAKLTIGDALKFYARPIPGVEFNEAELMVRYPNSNKLRLFGADNPDALRGPGFSGLSFDEYSQHPGIYSARCCRRAWPITSATLSSPAPSKAKISCIECP